MWCLCGHIDENGGGVFASWHVSSIRTGAFFFDASSLALSSIGNMWAALVVVVATATQTSKQASK